MSTMRRIAIIGAGQAGLILAHAMVAQGYRVTMYSDRTADQWLNESRPTGTAYLFEESIAIERTLGIDHWSTTMHRGQGLHIDAAFPDRDLPMRVVGRSRRPGGAIDQRMKFHRWMNDLKAKGGKIVIESVTAARLSQIAADSDLTIVAAGKGELGRVVPRHAERSYYELPPRQIAMAIVAGVTGWASEVDITAVKYSQLGPLGEIFWVPFTHKTAGESWSVIVEAKRGGPLDIFQAMTSGEQVAEAVRSLVKHHAPWDFPHVADMHYLDQDPFGWLVGAFAPTVRAAYGRLPSGALIMPVGDSAITFDPIGGQGGNNASRHAKFLADAIVERGILPFDEEWMKMTWSCYWDQHASYAYRFNNLFLEPSPGLLELLSAAAQDRRIADDVLVGNIMTPRNYFPWIESEAAARRTIAAARKATRSDL